MYDTKGKDLDEADWESFEVWLNHKYGFQPREWHHSYANTQEPNYPEHLADIRTVEKMWGNRQKREQAKEQGPTKNPLKRSPKQKELSKFAYHR